MNIYEGFRRINIVVAIIIMIITFAAWLNSTSSFDAPFSVRYIPNYNQDSITYDNYYRFKYEGKNAYCKNYYNTLKKIYFSKINVRYCFPHDFHYKIKETFADSHKIDKSKIDYPKARSLFAVLWNALTYVFYGSIALLAYKVFTLFVWFIASGFYPEKK